MKERVSFRRGCHSCPDDVLDRVTRLDYPDDSLDTTYTYDDPAVPFSKGRLTAISRPGSTVAYGFDRFGRLTQDGELTYGADRHRRSAARCRPGDRLESGCRLTSEVGSALEAEDVVHVVRRGQPSRYDPSQAISPAVPMARIGVPRWSVVR